MLDGYRNRKSGKWVRATTRPYRGRRSNPQSLSGNAGPARSQEPPTPRQLSKPVRITATVTIAATVTVGGITLGPRILSSGSGAGTTSSEVGDEGQFTVNGSTKNVQAYFKHATVALSASGFGGTFTPAFNDDCVSHSYGQMQGFFKSHPCKWLARAYIAVSKDKQNAVLIAISWVDMPTPSSAIDYKRLVDRPTTGNITELSRESGPYRDVIFNGDNYLSGIIGSAVWNVQVQPVGPVSASILKTALDDSRQ